MTVIQFHFNAPDRVAYACRLLRKALRTVSGVSVLGQTDELERLNRQLWTFEPAEFLPHVLLRAGEPPAGPRSAAPIWLLADLALSPPQHPVLVNLGAALASGFERFDRLVEVVSTQADDREAARSRWRHYAGLGYAIEKFEVGA
jgi:DNA polymerase III subunit chi